MTFLHAVYMLCVVLLAVAGLLALLRLGWGPTLLDRAVSMDVVTAVTIGTVAVIIVAWRRDDLMALLVVLALTGYFSAVTIARFAVRENPSERRILSQQEAAAVERQRRERESRDADRERIASLDEEFTAGDKEADE